MSIQTGVIADSRRQGLALPNVVQVPQHTVSIVLPVGVTLHIINVIY